MIFSKFNRAEKIFLLILIFTIFSGALRKWLFRNSFFGDLIFLIQLLVPYLILFSGSYFFKLWKNSILLFYFISLIFLAFNPLNFTFFHGFFGILLNFNFWIVLFFYFFNRYSINLKNLVPFLVVFSFFEIILAFIQYQLPSTHLLNTYANVEVVGGDIAKVGDAVRVTGTFSYLSGFTGFLGFIVFFAWYLLKINYNSTIVSILYVGGLICSLMSGSRTSTAFFLFISFSFLIFEINLSSLLAFLKKLFLPLILGFAFFLAKGEIGIESTILRSFVNFEDRRIANRDSGEEQQRLFWDLTEVLNFKGDYPLFGVGLGSTYQGATQLFGTSDYVLKFGYYENELTRVILEGGYFLLILRFLLFIYAFSHFTFSFYTKFIIFILLFYFTPIVFNIYNSIFFSFGLIFVDSINNLKIKNISNSC